jgi:hypothetical protein
MLSQGAFVRISGPSNVEEGFFQGNARVRPVLEMLASCSSLKIINVSVFAINQQHWLLQPQVLGHFTRKHMQDMTCDILLG